MGVDRIIIRRRDQNAPIKIKHNNICNWICLSVAAFIIFIVAVGGLTLGVISIIDIANDIWKGHNSTTTYTNKNVVEFGDDVPDEYGHLATLGFGRRGDFSSNVELVANIDSVSGYQSLNIFFTNGTDLPLAVKNSVCYSGPAIKILEGVSNGCFQGYFGINNNNPLNALDIIGNAVISGSCSITQNLTIDQNLYVGNAYVNGTFLASNATFINVNVQQFYANGISVSGDLSVSNNITTQLLSTNSTTTQTLTATTVSVTNDLTVTNNITSNYASVTNNVNIGNNLIVSNNITTNDVTANNMVVLNTTTMNNIIVNGTLDINTPVGSYTANAIGFLFVGIQISISYYIIGKLVTLIAPQTIYPCNASNLTLDSLPAVIQPVSAPKSVISISVTETITYGQLAYIGSGLLQIFPYINGTLGSFPIGPYCGFNVFSYTYLLP